LSEVIKEAGGLKPEAYPQGAEFYREPEHLATAGQKQTASVISRLNDLLNQSQYQRELARSDIDRFKALGAAGRQQPALSIPGLTPNMESSVPNPVSAAGAAAGTSNLFSRDLVSRPRVLGPAELEPYGNVAVNLAEALKNPGGSEDVLMLYGDKVTIPVTPTTIQVIGAVIAPRGVLYQSGERVDYYIERAGGYAPDAAKDRILVIRLGGGLLPLKKVRALQPGDVILVPTQPLAEKLTQRTHVLENIFRQVTNSALVFAFATRLLGL
jgi:protein involved in polysaccharide export with SLBB domain